MKTILAVLALMSQLVVAAGVPQASGPAKVYEGPEGESITVVEVNGGEEVVAKFDGVKGDLAGQTALLKVRTHSNKTEYYRLKKKGSKTIEIPVMEGGAGSWRYLQPGVENWLSFKYSKTASQGVSAQSILNQYKP